MKYISPSLATRQVMIFASAQSGAAAAIHSGDCGVKTENNNDHKELFFKLPDDFNQGKDIKKEDLIVKNELRLKVSGIQSNTDTTGKLLYKFSGGNLEAIEFAPDAGERTFTDLVAKNVPPSVTQVTARDILVVNLANIEGKIDGRVNHDIKLVPIDATNPAHDIKSIVIIDKFTNDIAEAKDGCEVHQ